MISGRLRIVPPIYADSQIPRSDDDALAASLHYAQNYWLAPFFPRQLFTITDTALLRIAFTFIDLVRENMMLPRACYTSPRGRHFEIALRAMDATHIAAALMIGLHHTKALRTSTMLIMQHDMTFDRYMQLLMPPPTWASYWVPLYAQLFRLSFDWCGGMTFHFHINICVVAPMARCFWYATGIFWALRMISAASQPSLECTIPAWFLDVPFIEVLREFLAGSENLREFRPPSRIFSRLGFCTFFSRMPFRCHYWSPQQSFSSDEGALRPAPWWGLTVIFCFHMRRAE